MIRFLSRVAMLWFVVLSLLMGMGVIGARQSDMLELVLPVDGQTMPQTCWHGICPGQTTKTEALQRFTKLSSRYQAAIEYDEADNACLRFKSAALRACLRLSADQDIVEWVNVWVDDSTLRLGQIVSRWAIPSVVLMCAGLAPLMTQTDQSGVTLLVIYANGITLTTYQYTPTYDLYEKWFVNQNMIVHSINYHNVTESPPAQPDNQALFAWRGFDRNHQIASSCGA